MAMSQGLAASFNRIAYLDREKGQPKLSPPTAKNSPVTIQAMALLAVDSVTPFILGNRKEADGSFCVAKRAQARRTPDVPARFLLHTKPVFVFKHGTLRGCFVSKSKLCRHDKSSNGEAK